MTFFPFSCVALVWKHKATCLGSLLSCFYLYWGGSNLCQMLALCSRLISNDAKWPHELMCPGVKRGRPGRPLTPGSFTRLRSKHVPIDKGRCKGRRFSLFMSIQLTHQLLNHRSVFIKTLCPLISKQFTHSVQLSATHHLLCLSFFLSFSFVM